MARDDWRIRIELPEEEAHGFLERLGLATTRAEELADELKEQRLAVTRDGDTVFVYASSGLQAERARELVERALEGPGTVKLEHWLHAEERWDDEAPRPDVDEETLARGYAPWEVRVECESLDEARRLEAELESEGYSVTRTFRYVIAGTATREEAVELARRVHGEAEPGGELVYEVAPQNPFAFFRRILGGMGGSGTPL